nr:glycosyltransferase family 4 protein [Bacteroides sp.]
MSNKKLLYFASDYKIGLSSLLTDQLISLHASGVDVVAVAGEKEQEKGLAKVIADNGIRLVRIEGLDEHSNFSKLVKILQSIIIQQKISIIHVQNNWQLGLVAMIKSKLCLKHKLEIAYTIHGFRHNSTVKSRIAQVIIGTALFMFADHVICMTDYLRKKFRLLSYKIEMIPLGINDEYFISEYIPPITDGLHLIFPAQFREGKNQDLIIRSFAKFIYESKDMKSTLTLPGNGDLMERMKQLAKDLGIAQRVFFPGFISKKDVKRLYLESNAAIVASNSETFGQSIVEPYVLGRCVISTPVGIAPEIINDEENGFIFKNEGDLVNIFKRISANPSILGTIGKNNYGRRNTFTWLNVSGKYNKSLNLK